MPDITGKFKLPGGAAPLKGTWYVRVRTSVHAAVDNDGTVRGGVERATDNGNGATMTGLPAGGYEARFVSREVNPQSGSKDEYGWYPFNLTTSNTTWGAIFEHPVEVPVTEAAADRAEAAADRAEAAAADADIPVATTTTAGKVRRATSTEATNGAGVNAYTTPDQVKARFDAALTEITAMLADTPRYIYQDGNSYAASAVGDLRPRVFIGTLPPPQGPEYRRINDPWQRPTPPAAGTFVRSVIAGADDGYTSFGDLYAGNAPLVFGAGASDTSKRLFLRFAGISVPKNATITAATIRVFPTFANANPLSVKFAGVAADNPVAPATAAAVTALPLTTAESAAWTPTSSAWNAATTSGINTPSLVSIIQELVNRAAWAPSNAMELIAYGTGVSPAPYFEAASFDSNPANAPVLTISYTS